MAFLQSEPRTRIDLSSREMLAISRAISREFAPRFAKSEVVSKKAPAFSTQELLSISQEISREFAPRPPDGRANLVLLPVDPFKLHVYWQLPEFRIKAIPKAAAADLQLTLRLFKQTPTPPRALETAPAEPAWFDVTIDAGRSSQQVALPTESAASASVSVYCAALGTVGQDRSFEALVYSNNADIPALPTPRREESIPSAVSGVIMPAMNGSSPVASAPSSPKN